MLLYLRDIIADLIVQLAQLRGLTKQGAVEAELDRAHKAIIYKARLCPQFRQRS
jgi:hypothetical protein